MARHAQRITKYVDKVDVPFDGVNVVNFDGLDFPVHPQQIYKFEKMNPNISVNVYMLELVDGELRVVPCHLTKEKKQHHIRLLLIQPKDTYIDNKQTPVPEDADDNLEIAPYHYVWVKDLSKLLTRQNSKHNGKMYFCGRCLHGYHSETKLEAHNVDCSQVNECRIGMPKIYVDEHGNKSHAVKFKNYGYKTKVPFVVYADFESLLKNVGEPEDPTKKLPNGTSEEHEPFSCAFYVQCSFNPDLSNFKTFRGQDPGTWLAEQLQKLGRRVEYLYNNKIDMPPLSPEEEEKHQAARLCHICEKPFKHSDTRVHDHLTGKKLILDYYFTH